MLKIQFFDGKTQKIPNYQNFQKIREMTTKLKLNIVISRVIF